MIGIMICLIWAILEKMERSGIIEDIKKKEDELILLVRNDKYPKNWQHPHEVTDYVLDNFEKTGEINIFDIYVKNI